MPSNLTRTSTRRAAALRTGTITPCSTREPSVLRQCGSGCVSLVTGLQEMHTYLFSREMLFAGVLTYSLVVPAARRAPSPRMVVPAPPAPLPLGKGELALGFDFGTSGARCAVVDDEGAIVCEPEAYRWGASERQQTAEGWVAALHSLLDSLPADVCGKVRRIAVSGTSSSIVLCDKRDGSPAAGRGPPRMYDFSVSRQAAGRSGAEALELIGAHAPAAHTVRSPTSALAKLLAWHFEAPLQEHECLAHQADFVAAQLCGVGDDGFRSDWHNALKLGYDVRELRYPTWLVGDEAEAEAEEAAEAEAAAGGALGEVVRGRLPRVVMPGAPMGSVSAAAAARWGLPAACEVVGGTTDSIAAFLASGAGAEGDAVSSLGSTLAVKLLSATPCDDAARGVYSHRLADLWLVGGASNVGCAVLREQDLRRVKHGQPWGREPQLAPTGSSNCTRRLGAGCHTRRSWRRGAAKLITDVALRCVASHHAGLLARRARGALGVHSRPDGAAAAAGLLPLAQGDGGRALPRRRRGRRRRADAGAHGAARLPARHPPRRRARRGRRLRRARRPRRLAAPPRPHVRRRRQQPAVDRDAPGAPRRAHHARAQHRRRVRRGEARGGVEGLSSAVACEGFCLPEAPTATTTPTKQPTNPKLLRVVLPRPDSN